MFQQVEKTKEEKLKDHIRGILQLADGSFTMYKSAVENTFHMFNNSEFDRDEIIAEMVKQGLNVEDLCAKHAKAQQHLKDIDGDYEILSK